MVAQSYQGVDSVTMWAVVWLCHLILWVGVVYNPCASPYNRDMYPLVLALLSAFLFGASTPVGKLLLEGLPPFQLAGWFYLGAALGVAPSVYRAQFLPVVLHRSQRKNILRLVGAIGFGGVIGPVLLLMGLQRAPAISVSMWLNLELVSTALLGHFVFRDHMGHGGWLGAAGVVLASVLLSWHGGWVGIPALLLVACACVCWGVDNHLTALIDGLSPQHSTFWKGLIAGSVNLAIGLGSESGQAGPLWVAAAMLVGALAYGLSIVLYIKAAQYLGATRSQMIFSSAPFFGVALAMPLLGDIILPVQMMAALILIGSLFVIYRDRHSHPHTHYPAHHQHEHNHQDLHHNHLHTDANPETFHHHNHRHEPQRHSHPHWPDIHHRHKH